MTTIDIEYGIDVKKASDFYVSKTNEAKLFVPVVHEGKVVMADPGQLWFWTSDWQKGEREVEEYIQAGDYEEFDSLSDAFNSRKK